MPLFIGTLVSDYRKLSGQDHRSSWGDLAIRALGDPTVTLQVEGSSGVSFDIMKDVSGGTDPVILKGAKNGSTFKAKDGDAYYVANPANAGNTTFKVDFSA
jgi:hypothetical protein